MTQAYFDQLTTWYCVLPFLWVMGALGVLHWIQIFRGKWSGDTWPIGLMFTVMWLVGVFSFWYNNLPVK